MFLRLQYPHYNYPYHRIVRKQVVVPCRELQKYSSQKHNARAWMKLFGGLGLGIFGATVAAQFFFGKLPQPKGQVNS